MIATRILMVEFDLTPEDKADYQFYEFRKNNL